MGYFDRTLGQVRSLVVTDEFSSSRQFVKRGRW